MITFSKNFFNNKIKNFSMFLGFFCFFISPQTYSQSNTNDVSFARKFIGTTHQMQNSMQTDRVMGIADHVNDLVQPMQFATIRKSTDMVDCPKSESFSENLRNNLIAIGKSIEKEHCRAVEEFNGTGELSQSICLNLAGCFKSKFKNRTEASLMLISKAKANTAKEAIALTADKSLSEMLEFESLKIYAAAKYGHDFLPLSCKNVDVLNTNDYVGLAKNSCRTDILDKGIEQAMTDCKMPSKNCYSDLSKYFKDKKAQNGRSLSSDFFEEEAVRNSVSIISQSGETTSNIGHLFADKNKTDEQKIDEAFDYLKTNFKNLDPIFKSYMEKSRLNIVAGRKDTVREGLLSWIKQNKMKSSSELEASLESLRRIEAKSILEQKCKSSMTMKGLCQVIDDVIAGAEVEVEKADFSKMLSKDSPLEAHSLEFMDKLAKHVSRCSTFSLKTTYKGIIVGSKELGNKWDLFSGFDNDFMTFSPRKVANESGVGGTKIKTSLDGTLVRISSEMIATQSKSASQDEEQNDEKTGGNLFLVKRYASKSSSGNERSERESSENGTGLNSNNILGGKKEFAEETKFVKGPTEIKETKSNTGMSVAESMFADNRTIAQDKIKSFGMERMDNSDSFQSSNQNNKDAPVVKNQNTELLNRIAELESRLKSVNSPAQEIKKKSVSPDDNSIVKEEGTFNKEVASLQSELDTLKKAAAKKGMVDAAKNSKVVEVLEQAPVKSLASSHGLAVVDGSNAFATARAPSSLPSNPTSSNESRSEGATVSSASQKEGQTAIVSQNSDGSGKIESIVLAKVDSANGAPASTESINNMIFEESGKPFYIEEEGMVKFIVPEVVDGKIIIDDKGRPVFKKIVKGKVGEFKIADNDKKKKSLKALSPADVKRMDEQNRGPAIRYKEFKDVIKAAGAVKADTDV